MAQGPVHRLRRCNRKSLLRKMKYPPLIQISGLLTRAETLHQSILIEFGEVKIEWRVNGDEAPDLAALLEAINHLRQRRVRQTVAVVGEEDLLVLNEMPYTATSRSPMLRHIPVSTSVTRQSGGRSPRISTFLPKSEITQSLVRCLLVVQEVVLDDVRLVTEAQDKIPMPILAVILHDVPQDRLVADRYHRLRNALGIFANAGAKPTAEQDDFHGAVSRIYHLNLGNRHDHLAAPGATWRIWATISCLKFHGRIRR